MSIPAIIKNEYFKWLDRIDRDESLNEIDKKLINILTTNLKTLYPLSRSQGQRPKKIAELIEKFGEIVKSEIPSNVHDVDDNKSKVERISRLEVKQFRGFRENESFIFDKHFTYMYGPNGSGKSSFCEAIEYALLGEIEECDAKKIPIKEYLKNVDTGQWEKPIAYGIVNGEEKEIQYSSQAYRFCFIEKNRIDSFARISATTPKDQLIRISTLFGLDAFHLFVDGFTDTLEDKYLAEINNLQIEFEKDQEQYKKNRSILDEEQNNLKKVEAEKLKFVKEINIPQINNFKDVIDYVDGDEKNKGRIHLLQDSIDDIIPDDIDISIPNNVKISIIEVEKKYLELSKEYFEYLKLGKDVVFNELFNAINKLSQLDDHDKTICPACLTSLNNVKKNPYEYASEQLDLLDNLRKREEKMNLLAKDVSEKSNKLNDNIKDYNLMIHKLKDDDLPKMKNYNFDIKNGETYINNLKIEVDNYKKVISKLNKIDKSITQYNSEQSNKREQKKRQQNELKILQGYHDKIVEFNTHEESLKKRISKLKDDIGDFEKLNEDSLEKISSRDKEIQRNNLFRSSYKKIIKSLKKYRDSLPALLSQDIGIKATEFYNMINYQDPDFEKIDELFLPSDSGQKIEICFLDSGSKLDALQILSEGHIKCLGLALLLSKAVKEDLKFLVFDDIVNAIDDDHRIGIIKLLTSNEDLKNKQQIITSHGEEFVKNLELAFKQKERNKLISNIQFIPPDIIKERGVKIRYSEPKHYLELAEQDFINDKRRKSLINCRQATENILEHFWKKMSNKVDFQLSVGLRKPNDRPEAYSVINAICNKLEKIDISEGIDIRNQFKKLGSEKFWAMLNKGTHEEGENRPEFDRADIKELIELLKNLEANIKNPDIVTKISMRLKNEN